MGIVSKARKALEVHERDSNESVVLTLDPELTVDQRSNRSGRWSATVVWANSVYCILRERERGTIEAESEIFEHKYGKRRTRTGKRLRADAIEWARDELSGFHQKLREGGDLPMDEPSAVAGKLTWREAIAIIRKRKIHHRGKHGRCSQSQIQKYERILDTIAVIWPLDMLVEATSQSHLSQYHSRRQGDDLRWERDKRGNILLDARGRRVPERKRGRNGKPGRPLTPYAVIFPAEFNRRDLAPVDEVTATSDLKDLQTLLSRLLQESDAKARPFLNKNPLVGKDLGKFNKRKLEPATADRYFWTMRFANQADRAMAAKYPHHTYIMGMLRCILALAFHTGHRIGAICALRIDDVLLSTVDVQQAIGRMRVQQGGELPSRSWAKHWHHGAIHWRWEYDKNDFDRVIPISEVLRSELLHYLKLREAAGIETEWLFPRPLDLTTHLLDYDARDMLYMGEGIARNAIALEGMDPDELIPDLDDRAFHAYRALWENLRDDLGWYNNKNSAYAGGWTTNGGGSQQISYNRLKPYYIQAVVDGKSVREVIENSVETRRAKAAIQRRAPDDDTAEEEDQVA